MQVFLGRVSTLDVGLEIIDGPTVKDLDIVATALRKQVGLGLGFDLGLGLGLKLVGGIHPRPQTPGP